MDDSRSILPVDASPAIAFPSDAVIARAIAPVAMIGFLLAVATPVLACQTCTTTGLYNITRFPALWFWLLIAWTVVVAVADVRAARTGDGAPYRWRDWFCRPALLLFLWAVAASLMGGPLGVFALTPAAWLPFLAPRLSPKWNREGSFARRAPRWLRWAAGFFSAVAALTFFFGVFTLPPIENEPNCRIKCTEVRARLERVADAVDRYHARVGALAPAVSIEREDESLFFFPSDDPRRLDPGGPLRDRDLEDPFAYRARHNPFLLAPIFYPFSFAALLPDDLSHPFIYRDPGLFHGIQYFPLGTGYLLTARGPDTVFSPEIRDVALRSPDSLTVPPDDSHTKDRSRTRYPVALTSHLYDPTNGIFSPGDIVLLTRDPD